MFCSTDCVNPEWGHIKLLIIEASITFGIVAGIGILLCIVRQTGSIVRLHQPAKQMLEQTHAKSFLIFVSATSSIVAWRFVMRSMSGQQDLMWVWIEFFVGALLALESLLHGLYAVTTSMRAVLSFCSSRLVLDCFLVVSMVSRPTLDGTKETQTWANFSFLAPLRIISTLKLYMKHAPSLRRQRMSIPALIVTVLVYTFVLGVSMRFLESFDYAGSGSFVSEEDEYNANAAKIVMTRNYTRQEMLKTKWSFFASVYFILSTASTLGFGDLRPATLYGQLFTIFVIFFGVVRFAKLIGFILTQSLAPSIKTQYEPRRRGVEHIIFAGNPAAQTISEFLVEVYHADHASERTNIDCVVVCGNLHVYGAITAFLAEPEWLTKFKHIDISERVHVVHGNIEDKQGLLNVQAHLSRAIILVPCVYTRDITSEDLRTMKMVLSLRWYLPRTRLLVLLVREECKELIIRAGVARSDVLAVSEFKMSLLGKSCETMGFIPFVCNLVRTTMTEIAALEDLQPWERLYREGMDHEIYLKPLSVSYNELDFGTVFFDILHRSEGKVYLIGIMEDSLISDFEGRQQKQIVTLNPGPKYQITIQQHPQGIFISPDALSIRQKMEENINQRNVKRKMYSMSSEFQPYDPERGPGESDEIPVVSKKEMAEKQKEVDEARAEKVEALVTDIQRMVSGEFPFVKQTLAEKKAMETSVECRHLYHAMLVPRAPPSSVLAQGGHVLICSFNEIGAPIGIAHFVDFFSSETPRAFVLLSPSVPQDWHLAVPYAHAYFVKGNPTTLFHLEQCCFHLAEVIVVVHSGTEDMADPILADAGPIFTTKLIEAHVSGVQGQVPQVIVDLLFEANHSVVQLQNRQLLAAQGTAPVKHLRASVERHSGPQMTSSTLILPGPLGQLAQLGKNASEVSEDPKDGATIDIQPSMAAEDPRFACGQLFVSTVTVTLLAQGIFHSSTIDVINALLASRVTILGTEGWEYMTYEAVTRELVFHQSLLPVAIIRTMDCEKDAEADKAKKHAPAGVITSFVMTTPPSDMIIFYRDRIMCIRKSQ
eukprot:GEMP01004303.1.p1 GENE.GEMP01004303.1~~GEMP01004303.1.p1  ORF type:complete len:1050 (-),score=217.39 GEMP01004303.1:145-3294(-)